VNPYQPPRGGARRPTPVAVARAGSFWKPRATFSVRGQEVTVRWNLILARECYDVDGVEVLRTRRWIPRGERGFYLRDRSRVGVRFRTFPFLKAWVLVDDEVVVPDLFPALKWVVVASAVAGTGIGWLLVKVLPPWGARFDFWISDVIDRLSNHR
jgi:hypothetical protein